MQRSLIIFLSALYFITAASPVRAAAMGYAERQAQADQFYEDGDYRNAFAKYRSLAKKGDTFSQYRTSYMLLMGQGTPVDMPESFAWAVLAAQEGDEQLVSYRDAVRDLVPEKKQRAAQRKAEYYMRKWGNLALAGDARRRATRELRRCTGSRLGTRCEEVYAQEMPKFWSTNPGPGTGGAGAPRDPVANTGGSAAASGSVSTATGVSGGSGRDVEYYQNLRASIAALDRYIQENSGRVELGEFKVLEPEADEAKSSEDIPASQE